MSIGCVQHGDSLSKSMFISIFLLLHSLLSLHNQTATVYGSYSLRRLVYLMHHGVCSVNVLLVNCGMLQ